MQPQRRLHDLAMQHAPVDPDVQHGLSRCIRWALMQVLSDLVPTPEELVRLEEVNSQLAGRGALAMNEAATVSLVRIRRERGCDLIRLPPAMAFILGHPDDLFLLVKALGCLAIAWQIRAHPNAVYLTAEDFR
jgi:hypothetical protein